LRRVSDLGPQRRAHILEEVQRLGGVRVSELTQLFGVSDMTIRRDLDALARRGLVAKVHGGATRNEPSTEEPTFASKAVRELAEKNAIAARAVALVRPGGAIALTAGSTTWSMARHLAGVPQLTVVTNSIPVAEVLHESQRPDLTVILTGGVRTPSDALVGPVAVATIRSLHVDLLFMGVHGADARAGLTTPNLMEAETNRAFAGAARHLVVLADHTKWGVVGLSQIVALSEVGTFVTDDGLNADAHSVIAGKVGELVVAGVDDAGDDRDGDRS
jgi:DeoR/GlpR family transcriptional regulator of sugar metabolism